MDLVKVFSSVFICYSLKVNCELPCISVNLSDEKVKDILQLAQGLPFPPPSLSNRQTSAKVLKQ